MRRWIVRYRRRIGLGLSALGLIALVTGLLNFLGARWVSAIQASTTVLLLLATGAYAYLTWRLVRATENPPAVRLASERHAVENVIRAVKQNRASVRLLLYLFPLNLARPLPRPEDFSGHNEQVEALVASIDRAGVGLPLDLHALALDATIAARIANLAVTVLESALEIGRLEMAEEGNTSAWDRVRQAYMDFREPHISHDALPDWVDLVSGSVVEEAERRIARLAVAAQDYLYEMVE